MITPFLNSNMNIPIYHHLQGRWEPNARLGLSCLRAEYPGGPPRLSQNTTLLVAMPRRYFLAGNSHPEGFEDLTTLLG
jgi:hypothetical protein